MFNPLNYLSQSKLLILIIVINYRSEERQDENSKNCDSFCKIKTGEFGIIKSIKKSTENHIIYLSIQILATEDFVIYPDENNTMQYTNLTLPHIFIVTGKRELIDVIPDDLVDKCVGLYILDKLYVGIRPNQFQHQ